MATSQELLNYERDVIEVFFQVKVPQALGCRGTVCNEDLAVQFAKSIFPGEDMAPVDKQGLRSFTLISRQKSRIIQFRLLPLDTQTLGLSHQVFGDKVPRIVSHPGFPLPVYSSNVIPGKIHSLQDFPKDHFPLERQLKTVTDLASLIGKSTWSPQSPQWDPYCRTGTAWSNVDDLLRNQSLRRLAPELVPLLQKLKSQLLLVDTLPRVLTHNHLINDNVLVDEQGQVTGVIDLGRVGTEAFGIGIWAIYECFLGEVTEGQWSFFNQDAVGKPGQTVREVLETAFWTTLWYSVSPHLQVHTEDFREAVKVAVKVGVISRYFARGMLTEIDETDTFHRTSLQHVRAILPAI